MKLHCVSYIYFDSSVLFLFTLFTEIYTTSKNSEEKYLIIII